MHNKRHTLRAIGILYASAFGLLTATTAQANELEEQLRLCAQRSADSARLACYDGLAESVNSKDAQTLVETMEKPAPSSGEAPATVMVDPSTGAPITSGTPPVASSVDADQSADTNETSAKNTDTFGKTSDQKQSIRVMIEKTKRNSRGDWYFYFDNGEVWKQIDTRNRRIPPLPAAATVSRGIFSSYKLHIDGEVWSMKIRRLK